MSYAEQKWTVDQVRKVIPNPIDTSVIGMFPRNLTLKEGTVASGQSMEIHGRGMFFTESITSSFKADTPINGSTSTWRVTSTIKAEIDDDPDPYVVSTSYSNTYNGSGSASGPSYDTTLLYISASLSNRNLVGRTLNGPIEFKNHLKVTVEHVINRISGDSYLTSNSCTGKFTYILLEEGGGYSLIIQSKNFPGWDFRENVSEILPRKERGNAA